jgi:transposase
MNKSNPAKRAQVLTCLVEGNSIRATSRMTGVAVNTVVKLLGDAGRACSEYQDNAFRGLTCKRVQCDWLKGKEYFRGNEVEGLG